MEKIKKSDYEIIKKMGFKPKQKITTTKYYTFVEESDYKSIMKLYEKITISK